MNTEAIEALIRDAIIAAKNAGYSQREFDAAVERVKADSASWAGLE